MCVCVFGEGELMRTTFFVFIKFLKSRESDERGLGSTPEFGPRIFPNFHLS